MKHAEELWYFGEAVRQHPRAIADELFPKHPSGYVAATKLLGHFATNLAVARKERLAGRIQSASIYENIVDGIYGRLPAYAKDYAGGMEGAEIPKHSRKPKRAAYPLPNPRGVPRRTPAWYRKQTERYHTQKSDKVVAEYIRQSRALGMHGKLVAAYQAGDAATLAGLLTHSRDVADSFEGGGGYNLMMSNAVGYVKYRMAYIGRLLAKAPAKPRARRVVLRNPRGVPAIKHNSVWELRRPTFAGEETRVYVREIPRAGYDRVVFRSYSGRDGGMTEASFRRQYKPVRGAK